MAAALRLAEHKTSEACEAHWKKSKLIKKRKPAGVSENSIPSTGLLNHKAIFAALAHSTYAKLRSGRPRNTEKHVN